MTSPTRDQVARVLEDLVVTASPSGHEAKAAAVLVQHATAWGLEAEIDPAGNVRVRHEERDHDAPHVVLLGHIDTVPGELPVRWDGDVLWGRGTVDAKGPLVAHLAALASLEPGAHNVTLIAAVGEEASSPGARALAPTLAPDALVIAEPTGLATIGLGYKGCLKGTLVAKTEPAHPGAGHPTASELLLHAVQRLTAWSGNPDRDPAFAKTSVRVLSTESRRSAAIDRATAELDIRLPGPPPALADLEALLPDKVTLAVRESLGAVRVPASDPVATVLRASLLRRGHEPRVVVKTGSSDWNVVAPFWQCPGAAYGPGDSTLDHTAEEHMALDEVLASADVLAEALNLVARRGLPAVRA